MRFRESINAFFVAIVLLFPAGARADIHSQLVAYYPFVGSAQNFVGNGHDGIVHGATLTTNRFGVTEGAYHFDGDDWIEIDATGFPTAERTVSVWFYATDVSLHPCLVAYAGSPSSSGPGQTWFMCINHAGQESFHMSSHWENNAINYFYGTPPQDAWYHFVVTTRPSGTSIYVNGEHKISNSIFVNDTPSAGTDFAIGVIVSTDGQGPYTDGNVDYFRGDIDDVRVYSRALTNADVLELYMNDGTSCGDSTVDSGEDCDDGNHANEDGCDSNCTFPGCGNHVVTSGEDCDDGNAVDGDGCESDCTPSCGNGTVDPAAHEHCDDGNAVDDDGCDSNCTLAACGNGVVNLLLDETCDDGNLTNDDGCDGNCTTTACNNGVFTSGEECDDGNPVSGDGCEPDCTRSCGNGTVDGVPVEICDDGNRTSGDGCDANCTPTGCGNGIVTSGEECDDGEPAATDYCDASCQLLCLAPPSGALAWWPGEGDAHDVAGGRNGSEVASVAYGAGKVGDAFSFDGTSFVEVADDAVWTLGSEDFSINLWVRIDELRGRSPFIGHDENGGEFNKWIFWYDESGHRAPSGPALRLHINSPTLGPLDPIVAPWNPVTGQWYHVAVTREGATYTLYIDGALAISEVDGNEIPDPLVPLTIGKAEGYLFHGLIDEVQIHERALSAAEIAAIHGSGLAGECHPCGDGQVGPNEFCDDANIVAGDGCDPGCVFTPESASSTVGAGEVVTTDVEADGATPNDPVETAVELPSGGSAAILENVAGASGGFGIFGHSIDITAPAASSEAPLVIRFRFDASQLPPGIPVAEIEVTKDGGSVPDCAAEIAIASPDPCVSSKALAGDGDLEIVVLSSSASTWVMTYCGDGRRGPAEECDFGVNAPGSACSGCRLDVERLASGTDSTSDCAAEWSLPLPADVSVETILKTRRVSCTDDDPACDVGSETGDDACTFRVALCFNVDDPRLECTSSIVRAVEVPAPGRGRNEPAFVANAASLAAGLASLGGSPEGVCTNASAAASSCAADSACDSAPDAEDGRCRRFVSFDPGLDSTSACSDPILIRVPLKRSTSRRNSQRLRVETRASAISTEEDFGDQDVDNLRLICRRE